jgi:predicted nucleic acid-binding protein
MLVLCDTGILLRVLDAADPQHPAITQALGVLQARGDVPVTSPQNVAEFWNVSTRPAAARGGYGLSLQEVEHRLAQIEQLFGVLPDTSAMYQLWRQLVVQHAVQGVQVHDAKLVAWMQAHGVTHLLTLNPADFARYAALVTTWRPQDVLSLQASP